MNRRLAQQFRNIETNFTKLIDQIIFNDSVDADDKAIEILQGIVNIDIEKQIDLLFEDLKHRNYSIETAEIYNVIWYSMVGEKEDADLLVKKIANSQDKEAIVNYLWYLNAGYNNGNKTEEEFDIEEVLYAVRKGEPINHRKLLKTMIKNIEICFSDLVERIIFYDSVDQDVLSYDIIIEIEKIPTDKLIKLMIKELHKRDYKISTPLMYNFMWYYFADFHDKSDMLVKEIAKNENKEKILNYLTSLNKRAESDSELNVQDVIDAVNQKSEIIENDKLKVIFADIEGHFDEMVNKMIYYEETSNFLLALDIKRKIENMNIEKQIDLLINYLGTVDINKEFSVFFNNCWFMILDSSDDVKNMLIKKIAASQYSEEILNYILDKTKHFKGDKKDNVMKIVETIEDLQENSQ